MIIIKYIHKLNKAKEGQVFFICISIRVKKKSRSSVVLSLLDKKEGKGERMAYDQVVPRRENENFLGFSRSRLLFRATLLILVSRVLPSSVWRLKR